MDWTGGTRRRFAKGKQNAVLARQKAHFAKVAKLNAASAPSFMQAAYDSRHYQPPMISAASTRRSPTSGNRYSSQLTHHREQREQTEQSRPSSRVSTRQQHPQKVRDITSGRSTNKKPLTLTPPEASVSVEADSLIAQKRKLLARSDWLGLAAAKPLRYNFDQSRDSDRIGKRRKVDKPPPTNVNKHEERVPTPAFQSRHQDFNALMSGALPSHEIQIKVGTDALATQTQHSRQSRTQIATRIRPISIGSDSLTEESMLLDVDEDGLEAGTPEAFLPSISRPSAGFAVNAPSPRSYFAEHLSPAMQDQDETLTLQSWTPTVTEKRHRPAQVCLRPDVNYHTVEDEQHETTMVELWRDHASDHALSCESNTREHSQPSVDGVLPPTTPVTTRSQDNIRWQGLLGIPQGAATQASIVALRSSSVHDSESATTGWFPPNPKTGQNDAIGHSSLDNNTGLEITLEEHTNSNFTTSRESRPSDSAQYGLTHTSVGTVAPAEPPKGPEDAQCQNINDEALWRSFLVDSPDGESVSAGRDGKRWNLVNNDTEPLSPAPRSLSLSKTYEARSDLGAVGDSIDFRQSPSAIDDEIGSSQAIANTSLVGHATTNKPEDESVDEESTFPTHKPRKSNIHTSAVSAPTRQRFKHATKRNDRSISLNARLFKSVIPTSTRATAHTKSVYEVSSSA